VLRQNESQQLGSVVGEVHKANEKGTRNQMKLWMQRRGPAFLKHFALLLLVAGLGSAQQQPAAQPPKAQPPKTNPFETVPQGGDPQAQPVKPAPAQRPAFETPAQAAEPKPETTDTAAFEDVIDSIELCGR
jgi:cell division protein FtsN